MARFGSGIVSIKLWYKRAFPKKSPFIRNGKFWLEAHAEEMPQLRALVISGRWDEQVQRMRTWTKKNYVTDWHWKPRPMSCKIEPQTGDTKNAV
jgi:hypothetical protein